MAAVTGAGGDVASGSRRDGGDLVDVVPPESEFERFRARRLGWTSDWISRVELARPLVAFALRLT